MKSAVITLIATAAISAQTARDAHGPAAVAPLTAPQPPAKLILDPPVSESLADGLVVIQYRTENLRILPVFGPAALSVTPRIGHLHVAVDDAPWAWAHTSGEELIIQGLPPGPHKVVIDAVDSDHHVLDGGVVKFEVPVKHTQTGASGTTDQPATERARVQPAPKLIVDPPQPERLARGLVLIKYRAENLQVAPVFGEAALSVTPRLGHIHVTVDGAPWHWADGAGGPVIVNGLPPGPHKILIQLASPLHKPLDSSLVEFVIPE
jgi:hypothetical protein